MGAILYSWTTNSDNFDKEGNYVFLDSRYCMEGEVGGRLESNTVCSRGSRSENDSSEESEVENRGDRVKRTELRVESFHFG